jgi:hypothetical protein
LICNSKSRSIVGISFMASAAHTNSEPHVCELARLLVMVLSGVGEQPVRLAELVLWLGESRARTKVAIELAKGRGWIAQDQKGVTLLGAGRKILNGARPSY